MPTVPTSEPDLLYAGETWAWTKAESQYPAGTYTLKYALQLPGTATIITLTATASGTTHVISVTAATTAAYTPGVYIWTSYAESGLTRYKVASGAISILPSPLTAMGTTHATRALALIEAALEGRIPRGLEDTNIDGQSLSRMPIAELHRLRVKYQFEVSNEQNRAAMRAGLGNRRNIYARFTRPR